MMVRKEKFTCGLENAPQDMRCCGQHRRRVTGSTILPSSRKLGQPFALNSLSNAFADRPRGASNNRFPVLLSKNSRVVPCRFAACSSWVNPSLLRAKPMLAMFVCQSAEPDVCINVGRQCSNLITYLDFRLHRD